MLGSEGMIKEELCKAFDTELPETILTTLASICNSFTISPEDLFYKWDAYSMNLPESRDVPTIQDLEKLRSQLSREREKQINSNLTAKNKSLGFLHPKVSSGHAKIIPLSSQNGKSKLLPQSKSSVSQYNSNSNDIPQTPHSKQRPSSSMASSFDLLSSPLMGQSAFSPATKVMTPNQTFTSPIHTMKFADRLNRAKKEDVFNDHISFDNPVASEPSRVDISLVPGQQTGGYRYMYEKLTENGELLNERINAFARILAQQYAQEKSTAKEEVVASKMEIDEPDEHHEMNQKEDPLRWISNPSHPTSESVFSVGMISSDLIEDSYRINDQSILLQTSKEIGGGARVKLNISPLIEADESFCFFPGQIIGVLGNNPSGRVFNVTKIYYPETLPVASSTLRDLYDKYQKEKDPRPVHIQVASGPYTLEDSIKYEPLESLVEVVEKNPPDLIILMGPFVDANHPMILRGEVEEDPATLFKREIASRIRRMSLTRKNLKIVLIPAIQDLVTEWVAFPQPPLAARIDEKESRKRRQELGLDIENVYLFPNPVQFMVNEMIFAVSTTDVVFDLVASDFSRSIGKGQDRISTHYKELLSQRSFYPLFPPTKGVSFDSNRALASDEEGPIVLQATPDVLIMPSKLRPGTRLVSSTICVNPGRLAREQAGGVFSQLCIHPFQFPDALDEDAAEDMMEHAVGQRARVEINEKYPCKKQACALQACIAKIQYGDDSMCQSQRDAFEACCRLFLGNEDARPACGFVWKKWGALPDDQKTDSHGNQ